MIRQGKYSQNGKVFDYFIYLCEDIHHIKLMTFRNICIFLAVAASAFVSCKKDDNNKDKYLEGTVKFDVPEFVTPGSAIRAIASGAKHPEGHDIGYCWKFSKIMNKYDTTKYIGSKENRYFEYVLPDSVGTFTLYCYAFSDDDYYPISRTQGITAVNDQSVTRPFDKSSTVFHDGRDNSDYHTAIIGSHEYFCENLHFKGEEGLGIGFRKSELMSSLFGRFYNWDEAVKACPKGWRLPSEEELAKDFQSISEKTLKPHEPWGNIGGELSYYSKFNEFELLEFWPGVKVTNSTMFSSIPVGYATSREDKNSFKGIYERAVFWTADSKDEKNAYCMNITSEDALVFCESVDKARFLANVRCIRDPQDK